MEEEAEEAGLTKIAASEVNGAQGQKRLAQRVQASFRPNRKGFTCLLEIQERFSHFPACLCEGELPGFTLPVHLELASSMKKRLGAAMTGLLGRTLA